MTQQYFFKARTLRTIREYDSRPWYCSSCYSVIPEDRIIMCEVYSEAKDHQLVRSFYKYRCGVCFDFANGFTMSMEEALKINNRNSIFGNSRYFVIGRLGRI